MPRHAEVCRFRNPSKVYLHTDRTYGWLLLLSVNYITFKIIKMQSVSEIMYTNANRTHLILAIHHQNRKIIKHEIIIFGRQEISILFNEKGIFLLFVYLSQE